MSWRTIVINSQCKLSYKNNYLIIRKEDMQMIHLSEINTIVVETTQVSITSFLLSELASRKIKLVICDEKRNPISEMVPYYGAHNTSKKVLQQTKWTQEYKDKIWKEIIKLKICNQAKVLEQYNLENSEKLFQYVNEVQNGDITNREGHAAKVYFNSMFGRDFSRDKDELDINSALNYGYMVLLSAFSREIVCKGYITQLGINHKNEFNNFNLSCDLMEPFRPLVDCIVYENKDNLFDSEYKHKLLDIFNMKIVIDDKEQFLSNAIPIYIRNVIEGIEEGNPTMVLNYEL